MIIDMAWAYGRRQNTFIHSYRYKENNWIYYFIILWLIYFMDNSKEVFFHTTNY